MHKQKHIPSQGIETMIDAFAIPRPGLVAVSPPEAEPVTPTRWQRWAVNLGVLTMSNTKPPAQFNPTIILFYLAVVSAILGGFWWSYQRGDEAGAQRGRQEEKNQQLKEKIDQQEKDLRIVNEKLKQVEGR